MTNHEVGLHVWVKADNEMVVQIISRRSSGQLFWGALSFGKVRTFRDKGLKMQVHFLYRGSLVLHPAGPRRFDLRPTFGPFDKLLLCRSPA